MRGRCLLRNRTRIRAKADRLSRRPSIVAGELALISHRAEQPSMKRLTLCATAATLIFSFLLLGTNYNVAVVLIGVEGFMMSGDAPSISSLTSRESPAFEGEAFAFVQAVSAVGSVIAPWLVGAMGERYGLGRAVWLGPLFLFSLALISISWEMYERLQTRYVEGSAAT